MKTSGIVRVMVVVVGIIMLLAGISVAADKINVKGKITSYDIEAKTVTIAADDGKEMTFSIRSDKALQKLDDRLFKGDEVKIRYIIKDNKNLIQDTNDFKGTKPGC